MFACYACTIMSVTSVVYHTAFSRDYGTAAILALAGGAMFIIARTLHNEWRQGKL
jgi:hypothetical protein